MPLSSRYSRKVWEKLARSEAYYAVLSEEEYLGGEIDEDLRSRFFETGRRDIENFLSLIRRRLRPSFSPQRVLEYGCGVGRLLLPLARCADEVTGVDISTGMLEEASDNLQKEKLENFRLLPARSAFQELEKTDFDFILSYIVFQHIPPEEGLPILAKLAALLEPGGIGLFHLMIGGGLGRLGRILQRSAPGSCLLKLMNGRRPGAPLIPMYPYPMNEVLEILLRAGANSLHLELTDHGGEMGAILIFEKAGPPADGPEG